MTPFLLLLVLVPAVVSADEYRPLSHLTNSSELKNVVRIVHDPTLELSPQQAIGHANNHPVGIETIERRGGGYWVILPLRNDTQRTQWRFSNYNTMFSRVDFHWVSDGMLEKSYYSGRSAPPQRTNPMLVHGWHFPLEIAPGEQGYLAHYVQTHTLNALILELRDNQAAVKDQVVRQYSVALALGMMGALIIYNLFLSAAVRDLNYLWYGLHGIFLTLWAANTAGVLHVFDIADEDLRWLRASFIAHELFAVLFCYRFLEIAKRTRTLRAVFLIFICMLLASLVSIAFRAPDTTQPQVLIGAIVGFFLLMVTGLAMAWKGHRPAQFYALGWTVFSAAMIAGAMGLLGVAPLTSYSMHIVLAGSSFEMLFLALALAARIRELQRDKGAAEAAAEAQGAFIANVSHELRTPLHGILGIARTLTTTSLNHTQRKSVETIIGTGNTLLRLINNILDYTRLATHGMEYQNEPFEPKELAQDLISLLSTEAEEKGLKLFYTLSPDTPRRLMGDPDRIRQVLTNLLSNAIKFTQKGRIELSISVRGKKGNRTELRFTVSDTGAGIAPELKDKLFQRFSQGDNATGKRYGGAGLGLAICKELVQGMGGHIHFTTPTSGGSRFYFELPLDTVEQAHAEHPTPTTEQPRDLTFLREKRILVVDDVPLNQFILEQLLKDSGAHVDLAGSGRDAVEMATDNPYDVILMDINMPQMDGIDASRAIRTHAQPDVAATPIIGVTASVLPNEKHMYLKKGIQHILAKPFTQHDLHRSIREVLRSDKQHAQSTEERLPGRLLDHGYLKCQQEDMGKEAQLELFSQFRAQGRNYLADARRALWHRDAEELRPHIHRLQGMAAMCGCSRLAHTSSTLEQRLKASAIDQSAETELEQLTHLFELSADALYGVLDDDMA